MSRALQQSNGTEDLGRLFFPLSFPLLPRVLITQGQVRPMDARSGQEPRHAGSRGRGDHFRVLRQPHYL